PSPTTRSSTCAPAARSTQRSSPRSADLRGGASLLGQLLLGHLGRHAVLVPVALLGGGGVVRAPLHVVLEAVAVGVAGVGALGGDAIGLEGVVDAHLARFLVGTAVILVLAGGGDPVELGVLGGVVGL